MDNVSVKRGASGYGLFATVNIKKGEKIYNKYHLKIPKTAFCDILNANEPDVIQNFLEHGWGSVESYYISCSIDTYVNHSDKPNSHQGIALEDINIGDEILEDYSLLDTDSTYYNIYDKYNCWYHLKQT
jgi:hypothetical protein